MVYIKRLVMQGFKSFVRKTDLPFTPGINIILGPNGSGKSNIADALCFVLGRLSMKSIRAAKAKNLIFLGTKAAAPSKEATVEVVFDNSGNAFSLEKNEISIKRIVRRNGQSIYKINGQTKTRQEVLSLLAQAGIDPHGFNIILQGEIQNFVRMHTEERRKIIEEVSGISIYESRKEKSLRELEKTEERLRQIYAILRERTVYLNNLEKERQQALRYKKLEKNVERFKASIIYRDLTRNKKESDKISFSIDKKAKEVEKAKREVQDIELQIRNFESKIISINSTIQEAAGLEQEKLNQEITNLRADIAGMQVNVENYQEKLSQLARQKQDLEQVIRENESSIKDLEKTGKGPIQKGTKQKELEAKKQELEKLEEQRKKFYMARSELKSVKERTQEKNSSLQNYITESEFLMRQVRALSKELFDKKTDQSKLDALRVSLEDKKGILEELRKKEVELEKISYANENEIEKQQKLLDKISKMDICPVCKSKITENHLDEIHHDIVPKMDLLKKQVQSADKQLSDVYKRKEILGEEIKQLSAEMSQRDADLIRISNIREKEDQIRSLHKNIEGLRNEISELEKKKKGLVKRLDISTDIEQKYETARVELGEISMRSQENLDSEISFKYRELERSKISFKQMSREQADINEDLMSVNKNLKEKQTFLEKKKQQEEELTKRFQKLISGRDGYQKKIRDNEMQLSAKRNIVYNSEQEVNNLKIEKAKFDATVENLETEMLEFKDIEIIRANREKLTQKLTRTQDILAKIGTVNLRSLEVYDEIKKEYDNVKEKAEIISKEKEAILKIIHEIDIKKKKVFLKTLTALNDVFSKNFSQLSTKGQVFLELEDRKNPFSAGVNIIVKTGHGKYFDVKSLSGGEQTIVALSLIFAIQELNPYCFYMLDEIDAALDKRNSERLATLLKKYMQKGQYIVVTHNDEVITNATNLYGVSMHDGISKVVSLKI